MNKYAKRFIAMVLLLSIFCIYAVQPVGATQTQETAIQPRWTNVHSISLTLDVETSPLYLAVTVVSYNGTTYSNGTIKLLRNGVQVAKWTGLSATTSYFLFSNEDITRYSGTYELQFSITATRNGVSETVSHSKTAKY